MEILAASGSTQVGVSVAILVGVAMTIQWIAWRTQIPSIILLLLAGLALGPVTGVIKPEELLGGGLFQLVSIAVAVILFEGGLELSPRELKLSGGAAGRLITVGASVSCGLGTWAAAGIFGMDTRAALVLAAVLIVTGPTVVGPLLGFVRPSGSVGPTLRAEGILIDPIGATLALIAYEVALVVNPDDTVYVVATTVVQTLLIGGLVGLTGGAALARSMRHFKIPDSLANPIALAAVIVSFVISNSLQEESGLLTVTVMGMWLARTGGAPVRRMHEFYEGLRPLIIGCLFLLLAARVELSSLVSVVVPTLGFCAVLIFLIRPVSVFASTLFSSASWEERAFMAYMAPRGIVAAAVSAIFGLRLAETGIPGAEKIAPITFLVVIVTISFYGFTAAPLAKKLGLSDRDGQGVLIVGGSALGRGIGVQLKALGHRAVILDTDSYNINRSRRLGVEAENVSAITEETSHDLDLRGIGKMLSLTSSDEVNALSAQRFERIFGRESLFHLQATEDPSGYTAEILGRSFAGSFQEIDEKIRDGWKVRLLSADNLNDYSDVSRIPLIFVSSDGSKLFVASEDKGTHTDKSAIALCSPYLLGALKESGENTIES